MPRSAVDVVALLQPGWANWECGFVLSGLRRNLCRDISIASPSRMPVKSIGGIATQPQLAYEDIRITDDSVILLIGSDHWLSFDDNSTLDLLKEANQRNCIIGAICAATVFLAKAGLFEQRGHTSNGAKFLSKAAPNYHGIEHYIESNTAVVDCNLVTSPGLSPLTFAVEVFKKLSANSATDFSPSKYYQLYSKEHR